MIRIMNTADRLVAESLEGFVRAHNTIVGFGPDRKFICRRRLAQGKVALISGGGAGHEPLHSGFVGKGMLDAACTGHIFTSPSPDQILAAMDEVDTGAGCLLIVKNYDGDVMNFEMAAEMAAGRHRIGMLVVEDDVATVASARSRGRRGVAGTLVFEKVLGAAAEQGMSLDALMALGNDLNTRIRSMGVAVRGVTLPGSSRTTFALGPDEMEIGVGIHGEPGAYRTQLMPVDELVELLCTRILEHLPAGEDERLVLIVNGFGATPQAELYLAFGRTCAFLETRGLRPDRWLVGTYVTSLDMAGFSLTLARLDRQQFQNWISPVETPALCW